ncbi:16214_t:CDS:2 [Rhizophagus irregularis]|nr:16214_t:CDS:2 [Rhizophagus irregularis]
MHISVIAKNNSVQLLVDAALVKANILYEIGPIKHINDTSLH